MEVISLCLMISAKLIVHPNKSQFFWYETISLSCQVEGNSGNWTVKRNTSSQNQQSCIHDWGVGNESSCTIGEAYPQDTGVYWCESERGECSNTLNITVAESVLILESSAAPVTEGDKVTLLCCYKEEGNVSGTSHFSANFYKDGVFIGTEPTGNMIFSAVSTSDEGFYKCEHPTKGESPQSWMTVHKRKDEPLMSVARLLCISLLTIVYITLLIVCVNVHRKLAKAQSSDHLPRK
ncbi:sialoadhesin-like isoform X2 [Mugil cephalus]|uniref:sialoadhesin-like isoform X2 n=1 Tax=Mugil cephalus TaxID=48193 RepID=UPI001FB576A2|nr:sialoadhesin-like isoform X2 [Mugil cephalus]